MIRPVDAPLGQLFGENPTGNLPTNDPTILQFGNYQPDGHTGQDYKCGLGTPIRAVASGTVLHAGWMSGTYADNPWWIAPGFAGYCYVIDHGAFIGIYGHGQDGGARVAAGQQVTEGQVIGLSGSTGGSTGPHCHFEILPDGYNLRAKFYGRIDPETIFAGGVSPAGSTTTPVQEDTMTPEQWTFVQDVLQSLSDNVSTKTDVTTITDLVKDQAIRINQNTQAQVEAVGRVTQQLVIDKSQPAVVADQIVAAGIAKEVADLLAERLAS